MAEIAKECPICASRNVSFNEREKALVCRDCGTVIAGTPVVVPVPREELKEVIHEMPIKLKVTAKKPEVAKKIKVKKVKKAKPKKVKKAVKKKAKISKKPKKKGLVKRLLRRH